MRENENRRNRNLIVQLLEFRRRSEVVSNGVSPENDIGVSVAIMSKITAKVRRREEDNSPRIRQNISIFLGKNRAEKLIL